MHMSEAWARQGNPAVADAPASGHACPGAVARRLGQLATTALYREVALSPKPGLVSPQDSGSHRDMDFRTFVRSLQALRSYFPAIAAAGMAEPGFEPLRQLGVAAEARMLAATGGINTHRGAIFNLGLLCASAGALAAAGQEVTAEAVCAGVRTRWGGEILGAARPDATSHGAEVVRRHGVGGARGEAATGFPAALQIGLPAYRVARTAGASPEHAAVQALFALIATLDDTNLKVLLGTVSTEAELVNKVSGSAQASQRSDGTNSNVRQDGSSTVQIDINKKDSKNSKISDEKKGKIDAEGTSKIVKASRQTALDGAFFVIDKSIGVITVTAKPVILKNVEDYINNLKKQLYQQIAIEAKIIEVYLQDNSKIGLDWSTILKDFAVTGTTSFGTNGQVYPSSGSFISKVSINPVNFTVLLNALNEQGDTRVLANPKLTVLNGQPAIISVGKDIAYVKTVSKEVDSDTNQTTYTAEVDNVVQGIALGVMASVLDGKKIILHLTPITTDVEDLDSNGNIKMTSFGEDALQLGLPKVKVRQMSTMVEEIGRAHV